MKVFISLLFAFLLTACGNIAQVHHASFKPSDIAAYDAVVIGTFENGNEGQLNARSFKIIEADFSKMLAKELKEQGVFSTVRIGNFPEGMNAKALHLSGIIKEYSEGNKLTRMMVGFGAGKAHFQVKVNITDYASHTPLTDMEIARQSWWPLGGVVAATQTADAVMREAALAIAKNLAMAKNPSAVKEKEDKAFPRS